MSTPPAPPPPPPPFFVPLRRNDAKKKSKCSHPWGVCETVLLLTIASNLTCLAIYIITTPKNNDIRKIVTKIDELLVLQNRVRELTCEETLTLAKKACQYEAANPTAPAPPTVPCSNALTLLYTECKTSQWHYSPWIKGAKKP